MLKLLKILIVYVQTDVESILFMFLFSLLGRGGGEMDKMFFLVYLGLEI